MTLERILVAVSFSERSIDAVRKAARLAADRNANLTLLHVVEPVKRRSVRRLPAQRTLLEARVINARRELARYAGEIAAKDRLAVDFSVETGEKVEVIMRACKDADVLLMGGTSMGGLVAAFHMTTAERLIGKCGIPVLVVNGPLIGRCERALVPVDGSHYSAAAVSAAARLWPEAALTLLHAVDGREERLTRIHEAPSWTVADRHSLRVIKGHEYLHALAARARVPTTRIVLRLADGDAWRAVLAVQDELDSQVVVMMKRKATALADFLLGSTVRRLLSKLRCDVLVMPEPSPVPPAKARASGRNASAAAAGAPRTRPLAT